MAVRPARIPVLRTDPGQCHRRVAGSRVHPRRVCQDRADRCAARPHRAAQRRRRVLRPDLAVRGGLSADRGTACRHNLGRGGADRGPDLRGGRRAWRHWQGTGRALALAVLAASLIAEGANSVCSAGRSGGVISWSKSRSVWSCPPFSSGLASDWPGTGRRSRLRSGLRSSRSLSSYGPSPTGSSRGAPCHQEPCAGAPARYSSDLHRSASTSPRSALMNLRRRVLSLASVAALSLALVPTPALAAAVGGACAPGARGRGPRPARRARWRRPREGHRPGTQGPARPRQGQGTGESLGHGAGLVPRHHQRLARQPDEPADQRPDRRPQRRVRGRGGWRRHADSRSPSPG